MEHSLGAIIASGVVLLLALLGAAWRLSSRLTKIETLLTTVTEIVNKHNGQIVNLTAEIKAACKSIEAVITRR